MATSTSVEFLYVGGGSADICTPAFSVVVDAAALGEFNSSVLKKSGDGFVGPNRTPANRTS